MPGLVHPYVGDLEPSNVRLLGKCEQLEKRIKIQYADADGSSVKLLTEFTAHAEKNQKNSVISAGSARGKGHV